MDHLPVDSRRGSWWKIVSAFPNTQHTAIKTHSSPLSLTLPNTQPDDLTSDAGSDLINVKEAGKNPNSKGHAIEGGYTDTPRPQLGNKKRSKSVLCSCFTFPGSRLKKSPQPIDVSGYGPSVYRAKTDECILELSVSRQGLGADIEYVRLFHVAAASDDVTTIRSLLNFNKVDVLCKDPSDGTTALHKAAANNAVDVLQVLLHYTNKVDVIEPFSNCSPLHFAAANAQEAACKVLIYAGASCRVRDNEGCMPFHLTVRYMLQKQRSPSLETNNESVLLNGINSSINGSLAIQTTGTTKAANDEDKEGLTKKYFNILELFLHFNKELVNTRQYDGSTPLHIACSFKSAADTVDFLLKKGSSYEMKDKNGDTPLFVAVRKGNLEVFMYFLLQTDVGMHLVDHYGNYPYLLDKRGRTILFIAIRYGHSQIIQQLSNYIRSNNEFGDDCWSQMICKPCKKTGYTPLHAAVLQPNAKSLMSILLGSNISDIVNIDVQDYINGDTPLHIALKKKKSEICSMLVYAGASLDIKNNSGHTQRIFYKKLGWNISA